MKYIDTKLGYSIDYPQDKYLARIKKNKGIILWDKNKDYKKDLYEISIVVLTKVQEKYIKDISVNDIKEVRRTLAGKTVQIVLTNNYNSDAVERFEKIVKSFKVIKGEIK